MCSNHIEINSTLWYDNVDTCSRYNLKIWSNCHSNCSFSIFLCPISSNCPRMFSLLIFIISVNMDHGQTTQLFFDHCNSFSRFESTMTNPLELLVSNQPWSKGIDAREERNHWDRGLMPWIQMNIADVIAIRTTGFVLRAFVCVGRGIYVASIEDHAVSFGNMFVIWYIGWFCTVFVPLPHIRYLKYFITSS